MILQLILKSMTSSVHKNKSFLQNCIEVYRNVDTELKPNTYIFIFYRLIFFQVKSECPTF